MKGPRKAFSYKIMFMEVIYQVKQQGEFLDTFVFSLHFYNQRQVPMLESPQRQDLWAIISVFLDLQGTVAG